METIENRNAIEGEQDQGQVVEGGEAEAATDEGVAVPTARVALGWVLNLRSKVVGGAEYDRKQIGLEEAGATPPADGEEVRAFQTVARVADPEEYKRAKAVRGKAVAKIWYGCTFTEFGLFCPEDKIAELKVKVAEARAEVAAFNKGARHSRVVLRVLPSRVLPEESGDVALEVEEAAAEMEAVAESDDVVATRKAALRVQGLTTILTASLADNIMGKVRAARAAANAVAAEKRAAEAKAKVKAGKAATKAEAVAAAPAAPTEGGSKAEAVAAEKPAKSKRQLKAEAKAAKKGK